MFDAAKIQQNKLIFLILHGNFQVPPIFFFSTSVDLSSNMLNNIQKSFSPYTQIPTFAPTHLKLICTQPSKSSSAANRVGRPTKPTTSQRLSPSMRNNSNPTPTHKCGSSATCHRQAKPTHAHSHSSRRSRRRAYQPLVQNGTSKSTADTSSKTPKEPTPPIHSTERRWSCPASSTKSA